MPRVMLFTKEIETELAAGEGYHSNAAVCKIFNPYGQQTWVIFGQDERDPDILYGACDLGMGCIEYGGVRRSELEEVEPIPGCFLERDRYFTNKGKELAFFLELPTLAGC